MRILTEGCSEKYVKKLIGRTEIENGLKRLDKLTQEEARMAVAEACTYGGSHRRYGG